MGDSQAPTLESQFSAFAKNLDNTRNGKTITLFNSDRWLRQSKLLDDRKLTMTDTGHLFFQKYSKTELTYNEWLSYLGDLCTAKDLYLEQVKHALTTCGLPGVGKTYCNATFDSYLCWPPTEEGRVASQNCPPARLSDTTRSAFRRCGEGGLWVGKRPDEASAAGWTNYTPCFPPEVQSLFVKVYEAHNEKDAQFKFEIAQHTRNMEIAGFSVSLVALVVSLIIFSRYRSLRNNRTRIHKSLFSAMVVQVLIRLTVYIDQALIRSRVSDHYSDEEVHLRGIDNMPYVCEGSYVLLEYAITVMFMWMFIEGLYLHNVVTANVLRERISHVVYYATGWGLPFLLSVVWATATAMHYQRDHVSRCWYGYNFTPLYWIMQGPRLAVIMVNLVFLLNIMRVLIMKLARSHNSEVEKVRKAARAALVLLPLLGITNALGMIEAPLDGPVWQFAVWSYSTHFLRSFQGFFIALIYCFLNGEVRQVLQKHYSNYMAMRSDMRRHRDSFFHFMSSSSENRPGSRTLNRGSQLWFSLKKLTRNRGSTATNNAFNIEIGGGSVQTSHAPFPEGSGRAGDISQEKCKDAAERCTGADRAHTAAGALTDVSDFEQDTHEQDSGVSVEEET